MTGSCQNHKAVSCVTVIQMWCNNLAVWVVIVMIYCESLSSALDFQPHKKCCFLELVWRYFLFLVDCNAKIIFKSSWVIMISSVIISPNGPFQYQHSLKIHVNRHRFSTTLVWPLLLSFSSISFIIMFPNFPKQLSNVCVLIKKLSSF